jgi:hypothetical protein
MGIDFKRYFTIPTREVCSQVERGSAKNRAHLLSPYMEHLCSRFSGFQARLALPREHGSDQSHHG